VITTEMIEERLAQLRAGLVQVQAQANAYEGAIQDCEHWLDVLREQEKKELPE